MPVHKHGAAYHAQQCAEKSIKGFLTFNGCRVAKTHALEELAKLVEPLGLLLRHPKFISFRTFFHNNLMNKLLSLVVSPRNFAVIRH